MEKKEFIKKVKKNFKNRGKKPPHGSKISHWYDLYILGHDCKYLD